MTSSIPKIANNVGQSAEELLRLYRIEASHMEAIRSMREEARPRIDGVIEQFYQWMGGHPEMMAFFETEESMLHVRKMQTIYWERFLDANVNNEYLRDRRRIGEIHARIGLPVMFYIGAINMVYDELKLVAREVVQDASSENRVDQFESTCQSLAGLIHLDAGLICQSAQVDGHLPLRLWVAVGAHGLLLTCDKPLQFIDAGHTLGQLIFSHSDFFHKHFIL